MELTDVTLESLLQNLNIRHVKVKNKWFFNTEDLNSVYQEEFKFMDSTVIPIKSDGKIHLIPFLSWKEIKEHANYVKTRPSFDDMIDKVLGTKIKKK